MSGNNARLNIFPTRMALTNMKLKLKGAQTGHSLLKRKSEALTKRFRGITVKIDELKRKMGQVMQLASFSLAEVQYITGDISYQIQESSKSAQLRVRAKQENVSGVMLPAFEMYNEGGNGKHNSHLLGNYAIKIPITQLLSSPVSVVVDNRSKELKKSIPKLLRL